MILFNTISKTRRIIVRHKHKDYLCYIVPNKFIQKKNQPYKGHCIRGFAPVNSANHRQTFWGKNVHLY